MRTVLFSILTCSVAFAEAPATSSPSLDEDRTLTATELSRYTAPYFPVINACYVKHARAVKASTGELSIRLVVHRDGHVRDVYVGAPGVRSNALRNLERCIRTDAQTWHFPVRRDFTTAILPFYFLRLDIPKAGPQYSCWNPRGCRPTSRVPNS
jgi:hypothetical protein